MVSIKTFINALLDVRPHGLQVIIPPQEMTFTKRILSASLSAPRITTRVSALRSMRDIGKVRLPWQLYRSYGWVPKDLGRSSYSTSQYEPIKAEEQEIRLLRYSGHTLDTKRICCTLEHAKLTDKPVFVALSYAWGDPRNTKPIIVNGIEVEVTETLEMALQQLITGDFLGDNVRLWVDSICINQKDEKEKTWQVQLMREIYHQADFVVAWLGPGDRVCDEALNQLARVGAEGFRLEYGKSHLKGTNGEYPLYL